MADEVRIRQHRRTAKNTDRGELLDRIAQARAERNDKSASYQAPSKVEKSTNLYWPSIAENDARLFDDSDEGSTSKNTFVDSSNSTCSANRDAISTTSAASAKPSGRRRLRKLETGDSLSMAAEKPAAELVDLPRDTSESHISIADDDGVDDILCNKLGTLSLGQKVHSKEGAAKARTKIVDSFCSIDSADYGSAASSFHSGSAKEKQVQVLDSSYTEGESGSDSESGTSVTVVGASEIHKLNFEEKKRRPENVTEDHGSMVFEDGRSKFILAAKISTMLYAHQREGIRWLWGLHIKRMGGILGDDMGLGKTMQTAAFLAGLFESRLIKRALIVAPKTLIPHWEKELTVVGLGRKVKDYSGTSISIRESNLQHTLQTGGVLLTTYDIVRHNCKALRGDSYGRDGFGDISDDLITWDYLILDEGHLIKNPATQRAKSLKEIPSAHRIIISGTPIQNNLREMWALYDFCCPELLGDRKEFKAKYENLILSGNDKHASDRQKRIGSAVAQELRERIAPYFLRRMKSEVFPSTGQSSQQLSRKNDIIVWLRLSQRQRQMYTAFLSSETAHQSLEGSALAALTILKKICDHPLLLTKRATEDVVEGLESSLDGADSAAAEAMRASLIGQIDPNKGDGESRNESSCKIVFLMALLENLLREGHRTLIFAQTLKMLDIIQEEIVKRKYCFRRIDGKSKGSDRQRLVEEFQTDSRIPIFLLTSQVGGLGLTLTGADRVVIVDPAWNPSKDNQSVDRAYRIGQAKDVVVYRLMTCGTLEEKIYRKQVFKGGLFKVATEQKEQIRYFSQQDLRELLTVPKAGFDISLTQQQLYEEHANQFQVDEKLAKHIKFLESQGIAGVSHHDLLFSKTAPDLPPASADEVASSRNLGPNLPQVSRYQSKSVEDPGVAMLAQLPKSDHWKGMQRVNLVELDDSDMNIRHLQENITRLSTMLSNHGLVAKLPDGGENIRRRVKDLKAELESKVSNSKENRQCSDPSINSLVAARRAPVVVELHPSPVSSVSGRKVGKQAAITSYLTPSRTGAATTTGERQYVDVDQVSSVLNKLQVE